MNTNVLNHITHSWAEATQLSLVHFYVNGSGELEAQVYDQLLNPESRVSYARLPSDGPCVCLTVDDGTSRGKYVILPIAELTVAKPSGSEKIFTIEHQGDWLTIPAPPTNPRGPLNFTHIWDFESETWGDEF